jgi:hypothetical protein
MVRGLRHFAIAIVLLLAGCVPSPQESTVNGPLPPQPPATARLIFYRGPDYTNTTAMSTVFLNGTAAGVSQIAAAFFRDVAPGRYDISVFSPRAYPDQFKTVVVKAGDVFYIRIDALPKLPCTRMPFDPCSADTFIVTAVDPALGYQQIQGLRLIAG